MLLLIIHSHAFTIYMYSPGIPLATGLMCLPSSDWLIVLFPTIIMSTYHTNVYLSVP